MLKPLIDPDALPDEAFVGGSKGRLVRGVAPLR
jgi:hypothetical protein